MCDRSPNSSHLMMGSCLGCQALFKRKYIAQAWKVKYGKVCSSRSDSFSYKREIMEPWKTSFVSHVESIVEKKYIYAPDRVHLKS